MRLPIAVVALACLLFGCSGSGTDDSMVGETTALVYTGSMNGPLTGFRLFALRTGPNPKLSVTTLDGAEAGDHSASAEVHQTGSTMTVSADLPALGPVTLQGTLDGDSLQFNYAEGSKTAKGEAIVLGSGLGGLLAKQVAIGDYKLKLSGFVNTTVTVPETTLQFHVDRLNNTPVGVVEFSSDSVSGIPFTEFGTPAVSGWSDGICRMTASKTISPGIELQVTFAFFPRLGGPATASYYLVYRPNLSLGAFYGGDQKLGDCTGTVEQFPE